MDPFTFVAGSLAIIFALLALLQWRRAEDLDARVRELEAKGGPPEPVAEKEKAEEPPQEEEEEASAPKEPTSEPAPPPKAVSEPPPPKAASEPPPKAASEPPPKAVSEPPPKAASEPPPKAASEPPAAAAPKSEPPPKQPEPDSTVRLEALKVVADAFELARYLDFDAIVEKPATYRVTVPLTASNSKAVRFLEVGMFACLKHVSIEERTAILHIDTTKGPP